MKNIYKISLFLLLISISCKAQEINYNYLTTIEYNAIFIDGVNWINIHETRGAIAKMKALFGSTLNYKTGTEPSLSIEFWDKGFYFYFEDSSDRGDNYGLNRISIDSNLSNFTIKGKTVTIGDDISKLGFVKISTYKDGTKGILFKSIEPDDTLIFIVFDQITNKFNQVSNIITKIEYNAFD